MHTNPLLPPSNQSLHPEPPLLPNIGLDTKKRSLLHLFNLPQHVRVIYYNNEFRPPSLFNGDGGVRIRGTMRVHRPFTRVFLLLLRSFNFIKKGRFREGGRIKSSQTCCALSCGDMASLMRRGGIRHKK